MTTNAAHQLPFYYPRSGGDMGHVTMSVCLSVCLSVTSHTLKMFKSEVHVLQHLTQSRLYSWLLFFPFYRKGFEVRNKIEITISHNL